MLDFTKFSVILSYDFVNSNYQVVIPCQVYTKLGLNPIDHFQVFEMDYNPFQIYKCQHLYGNVFKYMLPASVICRELRLDLLKTRVQLEELFKK